MRLRLGEARRGRVWFCLEWRGLARYDIEFVFVVEVVRAVVRRCMARQGAAWSGTVWQGEVWELLCGCGTVRYCEAALVLVGRGRVRYGYFLHRR